MNKFLVFLIIALSLIPAALIGSDLIRDSVKKNQKFQFSLISILLVQLGMGIFFGWVFYLLSDKYQWRNGAVLFYLMLFPVLWTIFCGASLKYYNRLFAQKIEDRVWSKKSSKPESQKTEDSNPVRPKKSSKPESQKTEDSNQESMETSSEVGGQE